MMETIASRDRRTKSEMWSDQRSMLILSGVVCGILCGISDLSGVDRKSVCCMGNYGNEVSLLWHSHTHLKRLTGHRVNTTSKQCAFGSSVYPVYTTAQYPFLVYNGTTVGLLLETDACVTVGLFAQTTMTQSWHIPNVGFVIDMQDVPGVQDIWQISANTCEHRSNTSIEILIYAVTWTFDYHADIGDDENADDGHEYLYSGSVFVRICHSPDWNRGNACVLAFIIFFWYHSLSITQRIRESALMYAGWNLSVEVIMFGLLIVILVPVKCVQYILIFHTCAVLFLCLTVTTTLRLFVVFVLIVLSWTYQLIKWTIRVLRLGVVTTCRLLLLCVLNPQRTVCGVITLVHQFSVLVYHVGLVTISVIGSCLCHGLVHFVRNSTVFVTCLVSQLTLMGI